MSKSHRGSPFSLALAALALLGGAPGHAGERAPVPQETPAGVASPVGVSPGVASPGGTVEAKERSFDAGRVDEGAVVTHTFELRNTGEHDLTLDVDATCGCTVVDYDRTIAPGRAGKITASVKTEGFEGPLVKTLDVNTNDPATPYVELEIKAHVLVPIEIEPSASVQINARPGEQGRGAATLRAADGKPFEVLAVSDLQNVRVSIAPVDGDGKVGKAITASTASPKPLASGAAAYQLAFELPPDQPVGRTLQTLTVATGHEKAPTLSLYVNVSVKGEVEVLPERIFLHAIAVPAADGAASGEERPRPVSMVVKLRKPGGTPFEVLGVASSHPEITAELRPVVPGREYDVSVRYSGEPGRGIVTARVDVRTNVANQEVIPIPVFAKPPPLPPRAVTTPIGRATAPGSGSATERTRPAAR